MDHDAIRRHRGLTFKCALVRAALILIIRVATTRKIGHLVFNVIAGIASKAIVAFLAAGDMPIKVVAAGYKLGGRLNARGDITGAVADINVRIGHD